MANTIAIRRRIGSVKNTRQITKAMELVAASKMRRAQDYAGKTRDYNQLARAILTRIAELTDVSKHPLYHTRTVKTRLHVIISSDRGLAGAYNNNLFKQLHVELAQDKKESVVSQIISVGKQSGHHVSKLKGVELVAAYDHFSETPTANDIRPILNTIIQKYTGAPSDSYVDAAQGDGAERNESYGRYDEASTASRQHSDTPQAVAESSSSVDEQATVLRVAGRVDAVDVIFTDYKSSISQVVTSLRLLPAAFEAVPIGEDLERADFEPSVQQVLDEITVRLIESQLNQAFSEAQASEQTMRMMAMKNATDNASDLIDDLTLEFNSVRQAAITQELAEITGGSEAMK